MFGKDFYKKGNSVKRPRPFNEPPNSGKLKSCCPLLTQFWKGQVESF